MLHPRDSFVPAHRGYLGLAEAHPVKKHVHQVCGQRAMRLFQNEDDGVFICSMRGCAFDPDVYGVRGPGLVQRMPGATALLL